MIRWQKATKKEVYWGAVANTPRTRKVQSLRRCKWKNYKNECKGISCVLRKHVIGFFCVLN